MRHMHLVLHPSNPINSSNFQEQRDSQSFNRKMSQSNETFVCNRAKALERQELFQTKWIGSFPTKSIGKPKTQPTESWKKYRKYNGTFKFSSGINVRHDSGACIFDEESAFVSRTPKPSNAETTNEAETILCPITPNQSIAFSKVGTNSASKITHPSDTSFKIAPTPLQIKTSATSTSPTYSMPRYNMNALETVSLTIQSLSLSELDLKVRIFNERIKLATFNTWWLHNDTPDIDYIPEDFEAFQGLLKKLREDGCEFLEVFRVPKVVKGEWNKDRAFVEERVTEKILALESFPSIELAQVESEVSESVDCLARLLVEETSTPSDSIRNPNWWNRICRVVYSCFCIFVSSSSLFDLP
ncbi:hypothetical protein BCR33DRAFT_824535 [Rhizoclosmatium globosum]|uniref:Uncharacterized protein n=1 Tax=Rhizoclosmatium globosum TaxID=329046 RepID=A0A1Y2D068_9FUNG|nr:hypothetical protein BCR33DRAFT_824535 [Rhizoclosmatium globosum]|eukprot:ORY52689.1 hypothetical protein BCR33DRAFT_824535 [Rhizoclosmatium globosum]